MAALRHGITTVIIPRDNERDLNDIDPLVRNALNFVSAQSVDVVLEVALNRIPENKLPERINKIPEDVQKQPRKNGLRQ